MRNPIVLLLLNLLLPAIIHAQATDRERDGLKGLVQTVQIRQMTVVTENEKETATPPILLCMVSYNRAGNRTELAFYDKKTGTLDRKIVYSYDPTSKKLSQLATYDPHNVMMRKVVNTYSDEGFRSNQAIYTYNEDGTFYKKTLITLNKSGEVLEICNYREDGSLIRDDSAPAFEQPAESYHAQTRLADNEDRVVRFGRSAAEYLERDAEGNWTRGITYSTNETYSSGKKVKHQEVVYREFTYYR